MALTTPAPDEDAVRSLRARNALVQTVRARLRGARLDIRELAKELVISDPGHPEHGRVYITYATAEVSLRRTTWEHLGHLDGHGPTDPDAEPPVHPEKIISTLRQGQPPMGPGR
jgi:hypothetical protein